MYKKLLLIITILLIGALALSACGAAEPAEEPAVEEPAAVEPAAEEPAPSGLDSIIEEAKKEGELVVYSSYNVEQGQALHDAFMEKYPFITVEHVTKGGPDVASTIAMEVSADTAGADIGLTGINFMQALVDEGLED